MFQPITIRINAKQKLPPNSLRPSNYKVMNKIELNKEIMQGKAEEQFGKRGELKATYITFSYYWFLTLISLSKINKNAFVRKR